MPQAISNKVVTCSLMGDVSTLRLYQETGQGISLSRFDTLLKGNGDGIGFV